MIHYTVVTKDSELLQILALQKKNITTSISKAEKSREGYVTVKHDFTILRKMNDQQPHIIAKNNDSVVGYALSMTTDFGNDIDILKPMFEQIEHIKERKKKYIIMGQICIDKEYRNKGIFRSLYKMMKKELQKKYDVLITEVASDNLRSLKAHYAVGFKELKTYNSHNVQWHLIQWDFK